MWRYIIAIVLLAHGIGHIMPFMAAWTPQRSQVGFSESERCSSMWLCLSPCFRRGDSSSFMPSEGAER
jgi:hypothetical protein